MILSELWDRFLSGFIKPETDPAFSRRVKFLVVFTGMGSVALLTFGFLRLGQGRMFFFAADIILVVYLVINLFMLRRSKRREIWIVAGVGGQFVFLLFLFVTGGGQGMGGYWLYFLPVTAFALCGRRGGVWWMGALFLSIFGLYLLQYVKLISLYYPFAKGVQVIASLLGESAMVYYYASITERDADQISRHNQSLGLANQALEKEMIQRRQVEQELLHIRQAVNSLGDAVVIADVAGRHTFHNPVFFQMFGYSREEINKAGGMGFLFNDPQAGRRLIEKLRKGQGFAGEVEMHNKEGRLMEIKLRADAIKGAEGTMLGLVAVHADITRQKQAEKALKQSEERFRQVIGSISAHIYVTKFGPGGTPENEYISPNVAALTGYPLEMFADDWSFWAEQLIQPQDREAARQQAEEFKQGRNSELEYRITKKDGSVIWVQDSGRAERNRKTGEITVYGVISDISQSKYYEEVREALLADVRKVNAELADFAYIVSHDLKAPLRAISSLSGWLAEDYADKIDDRGKEQLQLLLKRTKRMHNLIDGILAYSRLGRIKPVLVEIDSHEAARQVIESLAPPENISVKIEGHMPRVVYDRTHFEQLIQNLCSNALKHLGKPRGRVTISCAELPQSWEFCVRDDGAGIEPMHFDRIFKIFQTLKPRDEVESTGIGLTIVKKTVELYGGKVRLESVPGQGAAFFFTVPQGLKPDTEQS